MPENNTGTSSLATPSPQVLKEGNDILRELQLILVNMGRDDRRKSPEFQEIMAQYKSLGAELHEARKRVSTETESRPATPIIRVR